MVYRRQNDLKQDKMSIFNSIFGNSENKNEAESKVDWNNLETLEQLDSIVEESKEKPVVIFKHSTRCSISRMALKQLENGYNYEDKITPYFLDLLNHRDISNEIANRFGVFHQSPQMIVIKDGKSVYNASHSAIDADDLAKFL